MHSFSRLILMFSLVFSLLTPASGFAQTGGGSSNGDGGGGGGNGSSLSATTTKAVVRTIKTGIARCQSVNRVYRFDCYRQTYHLAARYMYGNPAYAGALKAIEAVEKSLEQIVKRHADPKARPKSQGFQSYKAVKPASVSRAAAEMGQALDRAETLLLRSPERTGTHYTRIAEAVHSNKLLLRSRLYPDGRDLSLTAFA